MSSDWELEYVMRSQGTPPPSEGTALIENVITEGRRGDVPRGLSKVMQKAFPRWRPGHRPQGWVKTQNGTGATMGDSGREVVSRDPCRQRAGRMNVEVRAVPSLRDDGGVEGAEASSWGRGALRNEKTLQVEGGCSSGQRARWLSP